MREASRHELIDRAVRRYLDHWTELEKDQYIYCRLYSEMEECTREHLIHILEQISESEEEGK